MGGGDAANAQNSWLGRETRAVRSLDDRSGPSQARSDGSTTRRELSMDWIVMGELRDGRAQKAR
ncbi:hypothetical protein, partial [Rhodoblastus acidophilus]|uniref:hypothetical protein n=1 Tax=Rhodoblastus acidophilus TaxID=1074 RepID=UPI001AED0287